MRAWITVMTVIAVSQMAHALDAARYRILSDDRFETRRVVAVELDAREPMDNISKIADRLKSSDSKSYQRTIVNFYLPNQNFGNGSWATVSYTPHQQTSINGLSYEEVEAFASNALEDPRDRVGTWLANSSAIAGAITIYRAQGRMFIEWTLKSGIKSTDEVVPSRVWRGRRYALKSGAPNHFLVTLNNELEIRDDKGLVATAEPIALGGKKRAIAKTHRPQIRNRQGARHTVTQRRAFEHELAATNARQTINRPNAENANEITDTNQSYDDFEDEPESALTNKPRYTAKKPPKRSPRKKARRTTNDVFMENLLR